MTPDSSVLVAAFAEWHGKHESALKATADIDDLVTHAELETYSVLTRMPAPFRIDAHIVSEWLQRSFPGRRLEPAGDTRKKLTTVLAEQSLVGGAVYDALVAVAARDNSQALISYDRRAAATYARLGVAFELI